MNRFFSGVILLPGIICLTSTPVHAQKKLISDSSYKDWSSMHHEYHLSNDGRYVSYDVNYYRVERNTGFLVNTKGEEIMRTGSRIRCQFTEDSHYLVSGLRSDSILVFDLVKRKQGLAVRGSDFQVLQAGKYNWLVYRISDTVIACNLETKQSRIYTGVKEFKPVAGNAALLLQKETELIWLDLLTNNARTIFNKQIKLLIASRAGNHIAFLHGEKGRDIVYHYAPSMQTAAVAASENMEGLDRQLYIDEEPPQFSDDGQQLFFTLRKKYTPPAKDTDLLTNQVEIWNYRQPNLYSSQRFNNPALKRYKAVVSLEKPGSPAVQLENDSMILAGNLGNQYVLLKTDTRELEEYFNEWQAPLYILVSLRDGSRKQFRDRSSRLYAPVMSDSEKFITWCNKDDLDIYAYEVATGITRNVSGGIPVPKDILLNNGPSDCVKLHFLPHFWYGKDDRFLISDKYDCWLVDPLAIHPPVNITNGYGRKNRICFLPAFGQAQEKLPDGNILLRARNEMTGENGFCQSKLNGSDPAKKIMGSCIFSWHKINESPRLRKAKNEAVYIVTRQSAAQSINLFVTTDLINYRQLSHIQPEKEYNWMSSELLLYRKDDGDTGKAILYKPDNFDPAKKYPVIFHYYQERITELHDYRRPCIEPNQIDIPWYVSNGYLVCIPDINHHKKGYIAETVRNSVEGAARYLSGFPWVDTARFGAQGHSFGGYETLLLISHSRMFAAAQASAAVSDLVSAIGGLAFGDHELYTFHEVGQVNMGIGNLPWSNTQSYIDNSPVFHADKITTPLLLMHGYEDENVKFLQDVELFAALRRLQKPVWILGYKDGHVLSDNEEIGKDASLRQRQFFEHYLKGKPAPVWMTKGVNPEDRNFKSGLQLDTTGARP